VSRPRSRAIAPMIGLAVVVAACSSGTPTSSGSPTKTTTSSAPPAAGARYVALGSSYAAGIGIPTQSDGACARSSHNYASLVAAELHLSLVDVTCSGATTANVLTTAQGKNPPQIDAVTTGTSLVTFTVGGNDIGYTAMALACGARSAACTTDPAQVAASLATLTTSLTTMISTIRARAPTARIVMVTYPRLVPPVTCPALDFTSEGDQIVGAMGRGLEQVFVTVARATHVLVADPYALGAAHGPCAPAAVRWIAGHTVSVGFPYHPTPLGHQEMAALTERALQG